MTELTSNCSDFNRVGQIDSLDDTSTIAAKLSKNEKILIAFIFFTFYMIHWVWQKGFEANKPTGSGFE